MKVKVHHHNFGRDDAGLPAPNALVHVATIELDPMRVEIALEAAFAATQNVNGSWSRGETINGARNPDYMPGLTVEKPLPEYMGRVFGHRSSMPGDVMEIDGQRWAVASIGFTLVETEQA
jgi:hypothetical protein